MAYSMPMRMKMKYKMGKVMGEFKKGTLNIGKSEKKVKSRKQAIAIGMSYLKKGR